LTTTSPSWFPTWPAGFPDVQDEYQQTVPRQFPAGLYGASSDEHLDIVSIGEIYSWLRQGSTWVSRRLWPHLDVTGEFVGLWESALGLVAAFNVTTRRDNVLRALRYHLGTATEAAVQAIFAPLFGFADDPGSVSFASPSAADIAAAGPSNEGEWAGATNTMHINHTNETAAPDRTAVDAAIEQTKPTYQEWSAGQYQTCKYDTEGGYGTACYGA
jgi:hypothetical protein